MVPAQKRTGTIYELNKGGIGREMAESLAGQPKG